MARQTREDFKDFKTREYAGDKGALLAAINDVKENQKQSERKLEEKLDKMDSRNATQQGKVFDELSRISILLARMEGRLYPSASGHNKSEN